MLKALCVGHSTFDITLPVHGYPKENLKYRIENHVECGGGPASNGAYLLAKWGIDTTIFSVVGDDYYGDRIIEDFNKIGASSNYIEKRNDHQTSSSYIIANMDNGSRTIITSKKNPIKKLDIPILKEDKIDASLILIDGEHPETAIEILEANPQAISILDAGRVNDDTKRLGKMVSYVICSKDFAEEFCNKKIQVEDINTLIECHQILTSYFKTSVIITLEAKGSFTNISGKYKIIPSVSVVAVDSTGAGDIFHGAFTYFIGMGYSLEKAIHYASVTSAISVTRIGSRYSIPNLEEVLNYEELI